MSFIYEGLAGLQSFTPYVYLLVFLGGVVSAISICCIPILVMFSGYMGGHAQEGTAKNIHIIAGFILGMVAMSAFLRIIAAFVGKPIMKLFTGYNLENCRSCINISKSLSFLFSNMISGVKIL